MTHGGDAFYGEMAFVPYKEEQGKQAGFLMVILRRVFVIMKKNLSYSIPGEGSRP
jgi:hypothetical protein